MTRNALKNKLWIALLLWSIATTAVAGEITLAWDYDYPDGYTFTVYARKAGQKIDYSNPFCSVIGVTECTGNVDDGAYYQFWCVAEIHGEKSRRSNFEVYHSSVNNIIPVQSTNSTGNGISVVTGQSGGVPVTVYRY